MESDGSLTPSRVQERFARTYNDGIGAERIDLPVGEIPAAEIKESHTPANFPTLEVPHPTVLAGIEETAVRYAGHSGLRRANLSFSEWLNLYRANIEIESAYELSAVSRAGAIGLGQLMPNTANDLRVDPHDWRQNLDGSARYLAMMLEAFGDPGLALAAYNAGPEAVRKFGGIPPYPETENHVQRVLAVFNRLEGENS